MIHEKFRPISYSIESLLNDAFELLNKNGRGICIVVKEMKIVGILTDGDIRRFLLKT